MQYGTFGLSQDSSTQYLPIHISFFTISQRNKVLNFVVSLSWGSVQSPDAKRASIIIIIIIITIVIIIIIIIIINTLFAIGKIYIALQKFTV